MKTIGQAWLAFSPVLEAHDVFLCPTVSSTAIPCEGPDTEPCVMVNGTHYYPHNVVMTYYFDAFGRCPALTVPVGMAENGVPCGVQIVARTYDDTRAFKVASALESTFSLYDSEATSPVIARA